MSVFQLPRPFTISDLRPGLVIKTNGVIFKIPDVHGGGPGRVRHFNTFFIVKIFF